MCRWINAVKNIRAISVSGGMAGINAINGLLFTIQALEGISGPTTLAVPIPLSVGWSVGRRAPSSVLA